MADQRGRLFMARLAFGAATLTSFGATKRARAGLAPPRRSGAYRAGPPDTSLLWRQTFDNRRLFGYIGGESKSRSEGRRREIRRMERGRFWSGGGPAAGAKKPRWSAGRRSAPE